MRHLILLAIIGSAAALDQGGAEAAVARGWAAYQASDADHTQIVPAALAFAEALPFYVEKGDDEAARELQADIFWCRKRMTSSDLDAYLAGKPEAAKLAETVTTVADRPVAPSEAADYFAKAEAFAKAHPSEHLKLAIRYFEVASRFAGTQEAMDAQKRSLDEQVQAKTGEAKLVKASVAAAKPEKHESELNAKALRKLGGRAAYKDGVLTVAYDWSNAKQLADWDLGGAKPTSERGALRLAAGDRLTSKIHFIGEAKLTCEVAMENFAGDHLLAPNGLSITGQSYNAWFIQIRVNGQRQAEGVFDHAYTKTGDRNAFLPCEWTFTGTKAALKFAMVNVAKDVGSSFNGAFTLASGDGGDGFRNVVISGKVDEAWAKDFFELTDAPAVKTSEYRR